MGEVDRPGSGEPRVFDPPLLSSAKEGGEGEDSDWNSRQDAPPPSCVPRDDRGAEERSNRFGERDVELRQVFAPA